MKFLRRLHAGSLDLRLTRSDVAIFALSGSYIDQNGVVGCDETGRPMSDPRHISAKTGIGLSTVYSSLTRLEELGYLSWDRAWSEERRTPIPGATSQIRLLLSAKSAA